MKKAFLFLTLLTCSICSCDQNSNIEASNTKIDLNLSNFERYISYAKYEGFTGAAGFSPYEAWLEFEGLLSVGVYNVTITYVVDSTPYDFKLDVSGCGKTDYFDRNLNCGISKVSGTVTYLTPNTKIDLDLSNFESYVSYDRVEGYTGAAGYSPYKAWLEFKGKLSIGVYDITVTYIVDNTPYTFRLNASGGGKTDSFDRSLSCSIASVSGTVKYHH